MKKTLLTLASILLLLGTTCTTAPSQPPKDETPIIPDLTKNNLHTQNICKKLGGASSLIAQNNAQFIQCTFDDNTACSEQALLANTCKKQHNDNTIKLILPPEPIIPAPDVEEPTPKPTPPIPAPEPATLIATPAPPEPTPPLPPPEEEPEQVCVDKDGDGFFAGEGCTPYDCNDDSIYLPKEFEVCGDGIDNDCNGLIDEEGCKTRRICLGEGCSSAIIYE